MEEANKIKLQKVSDEITVILKDNNCGIVPVVQVFNNQLNSRVEIVLLKDKSAKQA